MPAARAHIHTQIAGRYAGHVEPALLRAAALAALAQQRRAGRVELTIVVTGNAQLRALNRAFRQLDEPTDVLSFSADERSSHGAIYLGDVIISYMKARQQAEAAGHAVVAELQLLTVHGVLHLLGHDHYTETERAVMWKAQAAILKQIGAAIAAPKL